jgi:hypothetical protein
MGSVPGTASELQCIKMGSERIGMRLSDSGKELIYNQRSFPLAQGCWDLELVFGRKTHLFNFYWQGEMQISLRHDSHREFFLWLYDQMNVE